MRFWIGENSLGVPDHHRRQKQWLHTGKNPVPGSQGAAMSGGLPGGFMKQKGNQVLGTALYSLRTAYMPNRVRPRAMGMKMVTTMIQKM